MTSLTPATRADFDALTADARSAFMARLGGSLWHLQRDDEHECWTTVEDLSMIARYGFTRKDFPTSQPPALPVWVPQPPAVITVTPRQARRALDAAGLLDQVEAWVTTQPRSVQIDYQSATEWRSDWPLVEDARVVLGWTSELVYAMFKQAQTQ